MSDGDFQDFVATHVVFKDEPGPLRDEDAARAMADAFGQFDKVARSATSILVYVNPYIRQSLDKQCACCVWCLNRFFLHDDAISIPHKCPP